ncbi:glucosamine-6-phosphate deaminase [Pleomorphomonas carboxyditropha]|uniref:Glucosamine-6-phosphate deaminase n=2 Tax=Pleomorphomonas carboxyditropha TaxID=2023338 RepID=A0A2G9WYP2_9HYPH|nr:glucosamine-6-phosphate deaminase [Pleomorphomonas carboxyditropha]
MEFRMRINHFPTTVAAAHAVADRIAERLKAKPNIVLGLATGATMEPVYERLVALHRAGDISFSGVTSFNLDEYVGLPPADPRSYRSTMDSQLFDLVDIDKARTFVPDGLAADAAAFASRYEAMIREAGGIDLQLLGIGRNGHIGFNEPGADFAARTRVVDLEASTLAANSAFFGGAQPPTQAMTMGIGTILASREIVVLATGAAKRDAVRAALLGAVTADCPATALRRHGNVSWWLDAESGAGVPGENLAAE